MSKKASLFFIIFCAFTLPILEAQRGTNQTKARVKSTKRVIRGTRSSKKKSKRKSKVAPPIKKVKKKKRFSPVPQAAILSMPPVVPLEKKVVIKEPKKRIVIFSCKGGGGHTAVSAGLKSYLKDEYDITIVNVFQEVLSPIDTLGTVTFGKVCSEDFYNLCLRCRWTNVVAGFSKAGRSYMMYRQGALENLFADYFCDEKPDLIISVMPYINAALLAIAQKFTIPFLVITNDLDTTNYVNNIYAPTYEKFRYTLAFDDAAMREKIRHAALQKDQSIVTGFPLRPEFFKKKDREAIKKDFNVHPDRPVVMVFMGGAGSLASYRYVRMLSKMHLPLHILVCLGRNERLRRNINKILLPDYVSITVVGFTDRIADLMAISDVLITKPGPGSVCEALESNVPMILDQTGGTIWWEELNVTFMVEHGFAESLTNFNDLPTIFPKYVKNSTHTDAIKEKMRLFKRERFDLNIRPLIKYMVDLNKKELDSKNTGQGARAASDSLTNKIIF